MGSETFRTSGRNCGEDAIHRRRPGDPAFTLIELLVSMCILTSLVALGRSAFQAINTGNDLARATAGIAGLLERARAYGMTNNTYVYVGLHEVGASNQSEDNPQVAGIGKVVIFVVASRDGTRGYNFNHPASTWSENYANTRGTNLVPVSNLCSFRNIHLAASLGAPPTEGPMGTKAGREDIGAYYRLGNPACRSTTPLAYPLGLPLDGRSSQFFFQKVISFDPQGVARIQYGSNANEIKQWMEIGLQETRGGFLDIGPHNQAAIQLDCLTGAVRIFRP